MTFLFYATALVLVALLLVTFALRASPGRLADGVRIAGPVTLGLIGGGLLLLGRAGMGGMLLSMALAWFAAARRRRSSRRGQGQSSTVRTAALEMVLDHDSGTLEGMVLAGHFEGRELAALSKQELFQLSHDLSGDGESLQLLETYLDGRFPGWREDAQAGDGNGHGPAQGTGPMTKEEAHKILGLEAGASTADIRKAHRRLMQRLHPDIGGSSFLAARINEAKDVLLSNHG